MLKSGKVGLDFSVIKWIVYILTLLLLFYFIFRILESFRNQIEYIKINYPERWKDLGKPYFTSDLRIKFMASVKNKNEMFNFLLSKEDFGDVILRRFKQKTRRYVYMLVLYIGMGVIGLIMIISFLL
ncbi:MAG: hypothetical protein LWW95_11790 [Candidatus Desulfofervidus auxilii]|nr:hypothetical protein [Candidatus Desulfofervidus auxilii]